jgi:hypothetical protein
MPKGKVYKFTPDDEQWIKDNYLKLSFKDLARKFGIGHDRIKRYLKSNNLIVPDEIIQKRIQDFRFKKGHTPYNKNKKIEDWMSAEGIEKCKVNRFKKGHVPHNTLYDGAIVERSLPDGTTYKFVRISKKNWKLLHQQIWIKANGPIPEHHVVAFKDGDTMNTDLDNLELISRIENVFRNSRYNYPREIIPSMVLMNKLEKQLKQLQDAK